MGSILLDYPDFVSVGKLLEDVTRICSLSDNPAISTIMSSISGLDIVDLQMDYVRTFDMSKSAPLYLTAFEYGDSRKRGDAMVEIKRMIESSGFTLKKNEIPDYVPLLLSFLGSFQDGSLPESLEIRLAHYFSEIETKIDSQLYRGVFSLMKALLTNKTDTATREFVVADTGEMPYPLRYEGGEY